MSMIGLHASHEQVHLAFLPDALRHAEEVGCTAAMCRHRVPPVPALGRRHRPAVLPRRDVDTPAPAVARS